MGNLANVICPHCQSGEEVYAASWEPDRGKGMCERCGGKWWGNEDWRYTCTRCETSVNPGELVGLFVPHLCKSCLKERIAEDKALGRRCSMCSKTYTECCC